MDKKIRFLSEHYTKHSQFNKLVEEVQELEDELYRTKEKNGEIIFPENLWSECADVLIMIAQVVIQHDMEDVIHSEMQYKLNRQLGRIKGEEWRERMLNTFLGGRRY